MNKILNRYLIKGFLKIIFNTILSFIALGVLLNLFEELEFFKNINVSLTLPFTLSLSFVPSLIIELLPFIIFIASMVYFLSIRNNTDLISIKTFGYSNLRIVIILACTAFIFGSLVIFAVNPLTAGLVKYYEEKKAQYSRDVDHLISINKNGVWIKERDSNNLKIITAEKLEDKYLKNISIYIISDENEIIKRIESNSADITKNPWILEKATVYNFKETNDVLKNVIYKFYTENSLEKINSLYKNLNTISFLSLITDYNILNKKGYTKKILNEQINRFIALPIFLFLMVVLASIFTIGSFKKKQNIYFILISIITCVIIYYFKDLSLALGQTEKISLTLSVWMPIFVVILFCSIGVIQINEK
jgi:LPS export ABC transporter permease LptG